MKSLLLCLSVSTLAQQVFLGAIAAASPSPIPFSSGFHQPKPPVLKPDFKANWNQHKWNVNISHIASGYMYSSPSAKKVRVDEAYDGTLGSSLFDYGNVTNEGVLNIQWLLTPAVVSAPQFFVGYVDAPAFPLIQPDLLITSNAVYAGVTQDPYVGEVTAVSNASQLPVALSEEKPETNDKSELQWNILFASRLPTTVLLDQNNVLHGYTYWDPDQRTYSITRLFNIEIGEVPADVFEFPYPNHTSSN